MFYLQQIVNGLTQGSIYALMAVGYSLIVGIVGLVTFTHGEVIMIGAFAGFFTLLYFSHNIFLVFAAGFVAAWVLGMVIDAICYRPFRDAPRQIPLICTIGFSIFLRSLSQVVLGAEQKLMPNALGQGFLAIGDIRITHVQIFVVLTVMFMVLMLQLLLYRTRIGIALRAVAMNRQAAALLGVNVNKTMLLGNCLGCALGGISGILLGMYYSSIHPVMGASAALKAFVAIVFGGLSSVPGAALGGLLLGVFENMGVALFSSGYRDVIAFLILIGVLLIRPSGLMGRKGVEL